MLYGSRQLLLYKPTFPGVIKKLKMFNLIKKDKEKDRDKDGGKKEKKEKKDKKERMSQAEMKSL